VSFFFAEKKVTAVWGAQPQLSLRSR